MIIVSVSRPAMALDRASVPAQDGMAFGRMAFDRGSVRTKDRDGRLHVSTANISKASVDPYYGEEIPDWEKLGLEPKKIYYLFRDPEELAKAAPTFNNLPILSKHIPVSASAPQKDLTVGSLGTDADFKTSYLQNSLAIYDQEAIDGIEDETKRELSAGYYYTADMTPGSFGGLRYDGVMRNIVGNHVALVEAGRAGPDVVVGDEMPRGLVMIKGFKSRTAIMLNGAVAAVIAPKLAMDAKLDLSKTLGGVTRKSLAAGKPDKLAASIIAAAKPLLAQDAELDADDVCKVIAAVNGAAGEMTEDEDEITEGSDPAPAVDADDDAMAKIMAWLKGKLSDEDMAELGTMVGQGGDEEPGSGGGAPVPPVKDKPAMDAAAVKRTVATTVAELRQAERDVQPIIGEVKIACDSAAAVYKLALDHLKIDTKGVHPSAYRSLVTLASAGQAGKPKTPIVALDHKTVNDDFRSRFPAAGKLV